MEAFSDGVIAILITIMVMELHRPDPPTWKALNHEVPVLLAYALSFVYIGIYWNNHHHMLAAVQRVSGTALWANLNLLFWLSLVPFTTDWMSGSQEKFATVPTVTYGITLLAAGLAYTILQATLLRADGAQSVLREALGADMKGKASAPLYAIGVAVTFLDRWLGIAIYVLVALMWLVPDRRVERTMNATSISRERPAG